MPLAAATAALLLGSGGAASAADGDHYHQYGPYSSMAECREAQLCTPDVVESCQEYGADPGRDDVVDIIKGCR